MRCSREAWKSRQRLFQYVSEAYIDAKLSSLQAILLKKGEEIVEYSNSISGLIGGLESAGRDASALNQKRVLPRGLTKDFDVPTETIMNEHWARTHRGGFKTDCE